MRARSLEVVLIWPGACSNQPGTVIVSAFGNQEETPYGTSALAMAQLIGSGYVAYNTQRKLVIVSHCGTNFASALSVLNDGETVPVPVDASLKTATTPTTALVHDGFQTTWIRTRDVILSGVQTAFKSCRGCSVLVAGHSLGAALALIDGVYLRAQLPASVPIAVRPIALPAVGNDDFVTWVDETVHHEGKNELMLAARRLAAASHEPRRSSRQGPAATALRAGAARGLDRLQRHIQRLPGPGEHLCVLRRCARR